VDVRFIESGDEIDLGGFLAGAVQTG